MSSSSSSSSSLHKSMFNDQIIFTSNWNRFTSRAGLITISHSRTTGHMPLQPSPRHTHTHTHTVASVRPPLNTGARFLSSYKRKHFASACARSSHFRPFATAESCRPGSSNVSEIYKKKPCPNVCGAPEICYAIKTRLSALSRLAGARSFVSESVRVESI